MRLVIEAFQVPVRLFPGEVGPQRALALGVLEFLPQSPRIQDIFGRKNSQDLQARATSIRNAKQIPLNLLAGAVTG